MRHPTESPGPDTRASPPASGAEEQTDKAASLLAHALHYARRGWSIVPVRYAAGKKTAAVRWKQYQEFAPDERRVREWFNNGRYPALAVVLGPVSGNLACRDFDQADAYHAWAAAHPDLAKTLPTVKTGRGFHVFFVASGVKTTALGDGELRGAKSLSILPPSRHIDGTTRYAWTVPLPTGALPTIDVQNAGLGLSGMVQKTTEENRSVQSRLKAVDEEDGWKKALAENEAELEKAIAATLPLQPGTRNYRVFRFARMLKSTPALAALPGRAFLPAVKTWHSRALHACTTKAFEDTWIDFLKAWANVRVPLDPDFLAKLFEKARACPVAGADYTIPGMGLLLSLCRELQAVWLDQPFFLSVRTAGRLLGAPPTTISRWLFLLEHDGWLTTVCKGSAMTNKATRFRFVDLGAMNGKGQEKVRKSRNSS